MHLFNKCVDGKVFMWRRGGDVAEVIHFSPEGGDVCRPFPAKAGAHELQEVNAASASWHHVCCTQFPIIGVSKVSKIIQVAPDPPSYW